MTERVPHIVVIRTALRVIGFDYNRASMGKLTTHVLDTARGLPAAGVDIALYRNDGSEFTAITRVRTNADGRCDAPLLEGGAMRPGRYRLAFMAGDYFRRQGISVDEPPFVDVVTIDFGIADAAAHYHVPLLVSPWSYTTYRGS
jgi:5-hydroxyisourate hydrolase